MSATFRPLEGIRVVEMSHMIMGPSCGMFLGYLGAEVIKVEPPQGDKTRTLTGMGRPMFPLFNRGKKSVTIDVRTEAGRQALERLLSTADVFVENFRDASLVKAGVDAETLRKKFPRLIFAACKGFLSGPYQNRTALDEVVQMMTGLAYMTGPTGMPLRVGSSANDIMGGLFAAFSVLAAILDRQSSGNGHEMRIGLFENCLLLVAQHMVQFELEGKNPPPMPEREFSWPVYDIFADKDGKQMFVGAVTEGQWATICRLLDLDHLLTDPRLQTRMDQINARSWTIPLVAEKIAQHSVQELETQFEAVGLPFSPISKPCDMYDDPHVMRPGGIAVSSYENTTFRAPALPFEVDGTMLTGGGDVPTVGMDNAEVLGALGLTIAEVEAATGVSKETA
ncbi:CaiB/BaiF CoA transferase family protein [Rhizobium sullae]|uniref:Crotonobetainyl-CoA:carnitine CoA-transferase CaiB-like acyl-CoA transferase n=1 Tax=Rhizobium sullae TaxID=50338 RepID=A0A4V6P0M9_RHISU|nr:CaiB/BaiF CoA-transferase family protein [Rhizobium sullae]TCU03646.1 crotonobetainyl-CoA:carnitine CoA-transferase CaiB-like acyl-CoA transferase [Rhizobium sullae]